MIYFDNAATTMLNKKILKNIKSYYDTYYNPSSIHSGGKFAKFKLQEAKEDIKNILNTSHEVIFTSSATESNNLVFLGILDKKSPKKEILVSKLEHKSVLKPIYKLKEYGFNIKYVNVLKNGKLDINDLINKINKNTFLVSVMSVNNETGMVNNIENIAKIIKEKSIKYGKIYFHSDITQSFGKINHDFSDIDYLTASFHKIHGPKGVGVIFCKELNLRPVILGGNQEKIRAGTENLPNILMSVDALKEYISSHEKIKMKIIKLEKYLLKNLLKLKNVYVNGDLNNKIYGILNISFEDHRQEKIITLLDINDIYVGTGAACNSNIIEKSETLSSMGLSEKRIKSSIRISLSMYNTKKEIDKFIQVIGNIC